MPSWSSNDPSSFGWTAPPLRVAPFVYAGHSFPGGVDSRTVGLFTRALDVLTKVGGLHLHSGSGLGDGDWGYEHRTIGSSSSLSFHSFGLALDINAPWNAQGQDAPPGSTWRMPVNSSALLGPLGILWGGGPEFGRLRDWMHIECHLSPSEVEAYRAPGRPVPPRGWPLPSGEVFGLVGASWRVSGDAPTTASVTAAIKAIQGLVGASPDGFYGPNTAAAVVRFQRHRGLEPDGLVGPLTWAALF